MSVGIANINNIYTKEMDTAFANSWDDNKNYNGNNGKLNDQNEINPMKNGIVNQQPQQQQYPYSYQDQHSLPNLIKDELLEMSFVARELNSNSKNSKNNPNDNVLLKRVSEIMDAYLSHFNIINLQYNYFSNKFNNSDGSSLQHPVVTSLINLNNKVNVLLEKLKSNNNSNNNNNSNSNNNSDNNMIIL
ncbi:hypothetical protein PIROE2DRAFT_17340 [Piromyces sp. E2]|nr:hypothetical protein PIROE2DRAFT_17340 [Piromyces sp. E2]|eukprot:OUM57618.1 hypothetical protein PIROE2DRAFT_17340 [Piromyces sp. E2]